MVCYVLGFRWFFNCHYPSFGLCVSFCATYYIRGKSNCFQVMTEDGRSLGKINELEFIKGYVFANVWFDDHLYKIDPATGQVVDTYNFVELYPPVSARAKES